MSLLMEALRKAEEAKRKIQTQNPGSSTDFSRAPANQPDIAPAPVLTAAPEPDFTEDELDTSVSSDYIVDNFLRTQKSERGPANLESAAFIARKKSSRASFEELQSYLETTPEHEEPASTLHRDVPVIPALDVQQRAAGAVFAAKQKPVQPHATRNTLLIILTLLVPIGAAVLWYLANSGGPSLIVDPALLAGNNTSRSLSDELYEQQEPVPELTAPAVTAPVQEQIAAPAAANPTASSSATTGRQPEIPAAANPSQAESSLEEPALTQTPAVAATEQETPDTATAGMPGPAETLIPNETGETASRTLLEVSHSAGTSRTNQQLLDAYASLQSGELATASTQYQQVLEQFPNNRDALLGNAAIAMRQGNLLHAREFYSRLMQLNPKDPLARTGLLQTVQEIDPAQHEQELQRLVQQHPDVAPLLFALGNLYAAQRRWNEAQSAYFDAFLFARQSNDGAINPDYAYNLAVSLEQLNQPKAALDYYRQAQTLASAVSPGFDRQELTRRIAFLEQNHP
jgi:Flp pilus assembly protein TadD